MSSSEEIYGKLGTVMAQSLNVDGGAVKPNATLQGDLGAESIDFLDLVFRLEREFGISIPKGELFPESLFQGDPEFAQDGRVTDKGMQQLRTLIPYADLSTLDQDRQLKNARDLFTVDLVARYIAWKLNHGKLANTDDQGAELVVN